MTLFMNRDYDYKYDLSSNCQSRQEERPGAGAVKKDRIRLQAKKLCSATLLLRSTQYFFAIYMIIYIRPVQKKL